MWKRVAVAGLGHNSPRYSFKAASVFSDWPLAAHGTELTAETESYSNADGDRG